MPSRVRMSCGLHRSHREARASAGSTLYAVYVTQQQDATLSMERAVICPSPPAVGIGRDQQQILFIRVVSANPATPPFTLRVASSEYGHLCEMLRVPIRNAAGIQLWQTRGDRFLADARRMMEQAPRAALSAETLASLRGDTCVSCLGAAPNVCIVARCGTSADDTGRMCGSCSCRPMWCAECILRWFLAQQQQDRSEQWLSNRARCTTCRAPFCLRDIALIAR